MNLLSSWHDALTCRNNVAAQQSKLSITDRRNRMQGTTSVMSMQLSPGQIREWGLVYVSETIMEVLF